MIQVKVKCFSQVKYVLGKDEMSLSLEPGTTSAELEKLVRNQAQIKNIYRKRLNLKMGMK